MKTISLNGEWMLTGENENWEVSPFLKLKAEVPGCVQLDLSREGYIPADLYMGENIKQAEKYECFDWWYTKTFECPKERENVYLVFEGVDCIAEYYLNDIKIGTSANAFIKHEFRIDDYLIDGENEILVHIKSATNAADSADYPIRTLLSINPEGAHLRKPAHSFGWDIMPRAVTSGLWRGVRLEIRDDVYFSQAYVVASEGESRFFYTLECELEDFRWIEIELDFASGDSVVKERFKSPKRRGVFNFKIENPKLWYPYGYGDANIYDGEIRIYCEGELIHTLKTSFGIRDVVLKRRDPDGADNGEFRFLINGIDVMCRGANWVPLDAFHSRDAERYERALSLVKNIGCNILRCWGGNVYEDHAFFDFCDRNGIMVWQDFAMACGQYSESAEYVENLRHEVTEVIRKLRQHPSIILWAGDNEVDACFPEYDPNDNYLTRRVIPQCVRDNDLARPYLPSSPYISEKMYREGDRSQHFGSRLVEDHLWGPRDYFKSDFYRSNKAHFVSEVGYHGCPSMKSIKKFITPERVWPYTDNPEWILHSSDQKGNDARVMLMEKQVRQLFGTVPTDPDKYVIASQISQAEAMKYFIERIRVARPEKTGVIWWNLLDGWPQMSDAVVDYYFEKKLAYYYIKRSQAPFAFIAGELNDWHLPIYACNDTLTEKKGILIVTDAKDGRMIYKCEYVAPANSSTLIAKIPMYYSSKGIILLSWTANDTCGSNHYLYGYPPYDLEDYYSVINNNRLTEY